MELSLSIVADYLPENYKTERFGTFKIDCTLRYPLIYEPGCNCTADVLYIARSETLPPKPPKGGLSLICTGQRPPAAWTEGDCQLLWTRNSRQLFALLNDVIAIFDHFNRLELGVIEEIGSSKSFDLRSIIATLSKLLENPVNVSNSTLLSLFETTMTPRGDGMGYEISVEQTVKPYPNLEEIKGVYATERSIKGPYFSAFPAKTTKTYCQNLFLFNRMIGCVYVSSDNRPFRSSDLSLANHFFALFESAFHKYLQSKPQTEPPVIAAFNALFRQEPLNAQELALLQLRPGEQWNCFVLRPCDPTDHIPLESMCAIINALLKGIVTAVVRDGVIQGIFRLRNGDMGSADFIDFEDFVSKMDYTAGISSPFSDLQKLETYFKFARFALEQGDTGQRQPVAVHFEDHILEYMVTRYAGEFPAEYLFPPGLHALIEHDLDNTVSYVETLRTYLNCERNFSHTAEALSLHRSSLMSRLKSIQKSLNLDLDDPKLRMYVQLCLSLIQ